MATAAVEVGWRPSPGPQEALVTCPVPDLFYGGARGGGKTDGLLGDWAIHSHRYGRYARGILFRRSLEPELAEVIKRSQEIYLPLGWKYNEQKHVWKAPNGATLKLAYLEKDKDAALYQGHSYTWVGFDEAGNWADPRPIDLMLATLRSAHGIPCVRRLTGNPGGVGHHWLKARYITPALPMQRHRYRPQPEQLPHLWVEAVFIPSKLDDNPYLRGTAYEDNIAQATAGNTALWQAWRFGNWDVVAGAAFDEWNTAVHVLPAGFTPPAHWLLLGGMDGGIRHHSWLGIMALGPEGDYVALYEWYWKNKAFRTAGEDVALEMRKIDDITIGPDLIICADASMFADVGIGGATQASEFQQGLESILRDRAPKLVAVQKKKGSRHQRVALTHEMLKWKMDAEGNIPRHFLPKARFHPRCTEIIRTLPILPIDEKDLEDVDTEAEDHPWDGWSYPLLLNQAPPDRVKRDPAKDRSPGPTGRRQRGGLELLEGRALPSTTFITGQGWSNPAYAEYDEDAE